MMNITKVYERDNNEICYAHTYLIKNSERYRNISLEDMKKCRDSIYTISYNNRNSYEHMDGIIGCRRVYGLEAELDGLLYYCQPYGVVYRIEFLYYNPNYDSDFEFHILRHRCVNKKPMDNIAYRLIKECLASKNDAFTVYRIKSDKIPREHEILTLSGFYLDQKDIDKGIYMYIHAPRVNK